MGSISFSKKQKIVYLSNPTELIAHQNVMPAVNIILNLFNFVLTVLI